MLRRKVTLNVFLLFLVVLPIIGLLAINARPRQQQIDTPPIESQNKRIGAPKRLLIPSIGVNADIQHVGQNQAGEMDVPSNPKDVAWYAFGPLPGEPGSSVIAGHLNGKDGEKGVFANLHKLNKGDELYIEDDKGVSITFIVRESRIYDPGNAEEVFASNDGSYLNLITCDGEWNENENTYSKRLIVFTDNSSGEPKL